MGLNTILTCVAILFALTISAAVRYNVEMERARPICKVKETYIVDGIERSCDRVKRHYRGKL